MTYREPSNTIQQDAGPAKRRMGAPLRNSNSRKHGHHARKLVLKDVRLTDISQQNGPGRLIAAKAEAIFADRGGRESQTELQRDTVDRYLVNELLRQSVAHWLLQQPSLVNRRKRSALPVIKEYIALTETSQKLAAAIGLERVEPPPMNLARFLAERAAADKTPENPSEPPAAPPASGNAREPALSQASLDAETSAGENVSGREAQQRTPEGRFAKPNGADHEYETEASETPEAAS